jgi:hypothetical protein
MNKQSAQVGSALLGNHAKSCDPALPKICSNPHALARLRSNSKFPDTFESLRSLHFFLGFFPPPIILHFRRGSFGAALPKSYLERTCGLDGSFVCKILRRVFAHPRDLACAIPGSHMRGETQGQLVFPLLDRVAGFLFRG